MTRVFATAIIILALAAGFLLYCNKQLKTELTAAKNKISTLDRQVKGYENEISKFNEAQAHAVETIEKVRTIVKTVKTDCDCYHEPLPDDIKQLLNHGK